MAPEHDRCHAILRLPAKAGKPSTGAHHRLSKQAGRLSAEAQATHLAALKHLPVAVQKVLALEGALKLKEISYIHAEGYPAGELKHGPLALVDKDMPVISIAPNDALLEKLKSNLKEVAARGGELYVFADGDSAVEEEAGVHVMRLPEHYGLLSPCCTWCRCNCWRITWRW
jgi:glucosamine--fructose-6-phosphate aminotransferase (isomerizing)